MKIFKSSIFLALTFVVLFSGCASINKSIRSAFGKEDPKDSAEKRGEAAARFSKQDNLKASTARKYRMTKDRMEEEAGLGSNAGSLWMMEGQNAYLFSPNTVRLIGDMLNVKLDGAPQKQLQTKVHVIAKLLDKIDHPESLLNRAPASQGVNPPQAPAANPPAPGAAGAAPANAAAAKEAAANAQAKEAANEEAPPKTDAKFDVQSIPTRITEIMKDGSYRVKGLQAFMIGKREYKAIVTGIVRPEDFNDDGTPASKLLDSQFDIVNTKKAQSL